MIGNRGSIIVGVIVASSLIVLTISYLLLQKSYTEVSALGENLNSTLKIHRANIQTLLTHTDTLNAIVNDTVNNPGLKTCKDGTSCPFGPQPLVVKDLSGTTWYDSRPSGTQGFTRTGLPCNSFNSTSGDGNCVYRYKLTWEADCPPVPSCTNPTKEVWITATLEFKPASIEVSTLNLTRHKMSFQIP